MPVTASEIASFLGAPMFGRDIKVSGVSSLSSPRDFTLCFSTSKPSVWTGRDNCLYLVPLELAGSIPSPHIAVGNPRGAFAEAATEFFAVKNDPYIASSARLGKNISLSENVTIGEYAVLEDGVSLGEGTVIGHHSVIRHDVKIGRHCLIKAHAVIGEQGLGIDKDRNGRLLRIPHFGSIKIEDECEIGSFTTVCRGSIDETIVGRGCKIDDHVHIAHNVQLGEDVIVVACAEISGGVRIGKDSWIGPNASIRDGVDIGDGCFVGIGAVVTKSLPAHGVYAGNPARFLKSNP